MKITIAKTAGFCMGVRRAVEMAMDAANREKAPIFTYGPLIHNPQVLEILKEKGISSIDSIPETGCGTVIIRAHGIPPEERQALVDAGYSVMDATCPRVIKVQSIISSHARRGFTVIIVGDRHHPEVKGLLGYAGDLGIVVEDMDALKALPDFEKAIIVAQTTQNSAFFKEVESWSAAHHPDYKVFNTICDSTEKRQSEVLDLCERIDAVIVVGGHHSGNTRRLADIARQTGKPAFHIETARELQLDKISGARRIGLTAGASTPNWIIKQVYHALECGLLKKKGMVRFLAYFISKNLMLSNLCLAAGAASLAYAGAKIQSLRPDLSCILIASLYLLCMHTINHMLDRNSDRYNDPERAEFYEKNRVLLYTMASVAGGGALVAAWRMGPLFFVLLSCMSLFGVLYNIDIDAEPVRSFRLKKIPGSKTMFVALAWGIVTAVFPALYKKGHMAPDTIVAFAWIAGLVFTRTAYFDILDMQGSRIAGRETFPTFLGEEKTVRVLKVILVTLIFFLPGMAVLKVVAWQWSILSACPVSMLLFLKSHEQGDFFPGVGRGFLMESHFIAAGLLAMAVSGLGVHV